MIASQYGWTDEQIEELSIKRMLHATTSIRLRQYNERLRTDELWEWQTRTLAMFTASTAMTDGENPLIDGANNIRMYPEDSGDVDQSSDSYASGPSAPRPVPQTVVQPTFDETRLDKDGDPIRTDVAKAEDMNLPMGSYEKLLGGFGAPAPE